MPGFDLSHLVRFNPPQHLCEKCRAIDEPTMESIDRDNGPTCAVCHVEYRDSDDYAAWQFEDFLHREARTGIEFADPVTHGMRLAEIAGRLSERRRHKSEMHTLFALFLEAKSFIHFTSPNISHVFIGALKLISHRIAVRGVLSGVDKDYTLEELAYRRDETPEFRCHVFNDDDCPHQKLVIVDGLIAIKGSINLTLRAWRKTGRKRELLEVDTNPSTVSSLNNNYFAPIWKQRSDIGSSIEMSCRPPLR